ncbi:hypothetical protein D3C85_1892700 [compost metagenome]
MDDVIQFLNFVAGIHGGFDIEVASLNFPNRLHKLHKRPCDVLRDHVRQIDGE